MYYLIHLDGELPRLGSGRRLLEVREGRKWLHLRCPFTCTCGRLKIKDRPAQSILRHAVPVKLRKRVLRKYG